jgi:hypothetical protein
MYITNVIYSCFGGCIICYNTYGLDNNGLCVKGLISNITNVTMTNNTSPSAINLTNNTIPIIFNTTNNTIYIPTNNTTPP